MSHDYFTIANNDSIDFFKCKELANYRQRFRRGRPIFGLDMLAIVIVVTTPLGLPDNWLTLLLL